MAAKSPSHPETDSVDISNFKLFLDIGNKVWKVKDKEFAVVENISLNHLSF